MVKKSRREKTARKNASRARRTRRAKIIKGGDKIWERLQNFISSMRKIKNKPEPEQSDLWTPEKLKEMKELMKLVPKEVIIHEQMIEGKRYFIERREEGYCDTFETGIYQLYTQSGLGFKSLRTLYKSSIDECKDWNNSWKLKLYSPTDPHNEGAVVGTLELRPYREYNIYEWKKDTEKIIIEKLPECGVLKQLPSSVISDDICSYLA